VAPGNLLLWQVRGYSYIEIISISKETLPDYENKIKTFYQVMFGMCSCARLSPLHGALVRSTGGLFVLPLLSSWRIFL
jgi:hypothetical protein